MKVSRGKNLTAGVDNTLFTVPSGYNAAVSMVFIANVGGSTASYSAAWHDGAVIPFQGNKSLGAGSYDQFGGDGLELIMSEGDSLVVTPAAGSTFSTLVTMDLYPHITIEYNLD